MRQSNKNIEGVEDLIGSGPGMMRESLEYVCHYFKPENAVSTIEKVFCYSRFEAVELFLRTTRLTIK